MKSNELTVGNQYAMDRYGNTSKYEMHTARLVRVTVITAPTGGKVHVRSEGLDRADEVVRVQKVVAPWDEYASAFNRHLDYQKRLKDNAANAAKSIPTFLPEGTRLPFWCDGTVYADGSYSRKGEVTVTELADLLALAYSKGQEDAAKA